jgi:hypothetical protein
MGLDGRVIQIARTISIGRSLASLILKQEVGRSGAKPLVKVTSAARIHGIRFAEQLGGRQDVGVLELMEEHQNGGGHLLLSSACAAPETEWRLARAREHFWNSLLPFCYPIRARGRIRWDEVIPLRRVVPIIQHFDNTGVSEFRVRCFQPIPIRCTAHRRHMAHPESIYNNGLCALTVTLIT